MNAGESPASKLSPEALDRILSIPGLRSWFTEESRGSSPATCIASGVRGSAISLLLNAFYSRREAQWLIVAAGLEEAEAICDDLETLSSAPVTYLPELEILPFDRRSPTREILANVQSALQALDSGVPGFFVTTIYGLRHKVMASAQLQRHRLILSRGERLNTDELQEKLAALAISAVRSGGSAG